MNTNFAHNVGLVALLFLDFLLIFVLTEGEQTTEYMFSIKGVYVSMRIKSYNSLKLMPYDLILRTGV